MDVEIIAIGSELLLGTTVDTNSAFLAGRLVAAGVQVVRKTTVGDNAEQIAVAVREAMDRADLILCTGGLGPTLDDLTRDAVALAYDRPLEFQQELLDQIAARFTAMGRSMSESNRRQAFVPQGSRAIENPRGTAPVFIVEDERATLIALPGVPSEMRFLYATVVLPYLRDERNIRDVILVRTLHAVGLSESVIGERIADLMLADNPDVGISAKRARYEIRIAAHGQSQAEAQALIDTAVATVAQRLGEHLIGDEPLPDAVARLLQERELTLAIYEGNARAPIYRALAAAEQGLAGLRGMLVHPLDRPTDAQAAASLAHAGALSVADRWRSSLGLAAQAASVPDENGFTAVCVTLVTPEGPRQVTRHYDLRQDEGWGFVGTLALDLLRRYLMGEAA
jgi:nicotinamide-nucleotide amidase